MSDDDNTETHEYLMRLINRLGGDQKSMTAYAIDQNVEFVRFSNDIVEMLEKVDRRIQDLEVQRLPALMETALSDETVLEEKPYDEYKRLQKEKYERELVLIAPICECGAIMKPKMVSVRWNIKGESWRVQWRCHHESDITHIQEREENQWEILQRKIKDTALPINENYTRFLHPDAGGYL